MGSTAAEKITDPPLDVLKPVADDLWIVDSGPLRLLGLAVPVRMTVVRLGNGDVWLHSPTQCDEALRRAIERLGPIRHLVAPNVVHWTYLADWQRRCPDALTWAAPGLRRRRPVRRAGLRLDRDLADAPPPDWAESLDQTIVPGGGGFREAAFFHRPTRTLILTDLVQNIEPGTLRPWVRPLLRLAGNAAPEGRAPVYLRLLVRLDRRSPRAAARLVAWAPERVIFAHGRWFDRDGTARLRRSLDWLLA